MYVCVYMHTLTCIQTYIRSNLCVCLCGWGCVFLRVLFMRWCVCVCVHQCHGRGALNLQVDVTVQVLRGKGGAFL